MDKKSNPLVLNDLHVNQVIKELTIEAKTMLRAMQRTHKISKRAYQISCGDAEKYHTVFAEYTRNVGVTTDRTVQTLLFRNGVLQLCSVPVPDTSLASKSNDALRSVARATYSIFMATKKVA